MGVKRMFAITSVVILYIICLYIWYNKWTLFFSLPFRQHGLAHEVLQWYICRMEAWFAADADMISLKNWDEVSFSFNRFWIDFCVAKLWLLWGKTTGTSLSFQIRWLSQPIVPKKGIREIVKLDRLLLYSIGVLYSY